MWPPNILRMTTIEILVLLLAASCALNAGLGAGILARSSGKSIQAAVLVGAGTVSTILTIFFTAVSAYR